MTYIIFEKYTVKLSIYYVTWPLKFVKIEQDSFFGEYNNQPIKKDIINKLLFNKEMNYVEFDEVKGVIREW